MSDQEIGAKTREERELKGREASNRPGRRVKELSDSHILCLVGRK